MSTPANSTAEFNLTVSQIDGLCAHCGDLCRDQTFASKQELFCCTGAIVAGTWYEGALYMAVFGTGTLPVMLALPLLGNLISGNLRGRIRIALPYIMIVFGLLFILRGLNLGIPYLSPQMNQSAPVVQKCH